MLHKFTKSDLKELASILQGDESASQPSTAFVVAAPAEASEADAPSEAAESSVDPAANADIYTQLLLAVHQDQETQGRELGEHVRELESVKGQIHTLRLLWTTTVAAIFLSAVAIVVTLVVAILP